MNENSPEIFLEDGKILSQQCWPGSQYVLRIEAPSCARHARPGSFIHLQCDPEIPMRRPLSIMRSSPDEGWVEVLYKVMGPGLAALARTPAGSTRSVLGPIGNGFTPDPGRPTVLLVGGGVGIPPVVFLAESMAREPGWQPLALLGSELPFPFDLAPHARPIPGLDQGPAAGMMTLEQLGVPSRLASRAGLAGSHAGFVTELAEKWLRNRPTREDCAIYACGPEPMLEATAALAARHDVPAQLCLEEYMACAVGGCAGCAVAVVENGRTEMRRVCVDGPVFPARAIYPGAGLGVPA
ncbi:MAG: dihydroorotate dehydrogenase electron transfer subunit [Chromatiales bacterium]|nr:dihydroorotate dehydrogenase electron transfer subunit [Chromatiales bacterium]